MDSSPKPGLITGLVAGVLNERELAINVGENVGVRPGMVFKVLADRPVEIRDPSSNDLLGMVDREKVRVKASDVQATFSICRTFRTRFVGSAFASSIAEMMGPAREIPETLRADDSELPRPLSEAESIVKKGDRVVQVPYAERED